MENIEWYHNLNQPFLSPPDWLFAPVWGGLYFLMLLSLVFLIKGGLNRQKIKPLILFGVQLILNLSWTPAFFVGQNIKLAFVIVCALWLVLFMTIKAFYKISKISGILLIPYFLWTTFALYLNFEISRLN